MPFQLKYFGVSLLAHLFCSQFIAYYSHSCDALIIDEGDPCMDPVQACEEWGPETLVYDPSDCHQFYACVQDNSGNGVPSNYPVQCLNDLAFDFENQSCSSKISSCDKACVNKDCLFECEFGHDGLVADPNHCNIYNFCFNGVISSPSNCFDSDLGPYFDGEGCTDKEYLCCDACTVYCTRDDYGKNISDPYDCKAYYTCEFAEGIPSEDVHIYCKEEEYFDSESGMCVVESEPCENICNIVTTTIHPITGNQPEGDPCKEPAEACKEFGVGKLVYDPSDCHQFYVCLEDNAGNVVSSSNPLTCLNDLTFDFDNQSCSSKISSCDKACVNKNCLFECLSGDEGYMADANHCNIYYFCLNGIISSPNKCSDTNFGSFFDGGGCTNKEYLCCDACTVYCTSEDTGKNVTDPYDCTAYYNCEGKEGIPGDDTHFSCKAGEYFDSDSGVCIVGSESCKNICDSPVTTIQPTTKNRQTTSNQATTTNQLSTENQHTTGNQRTTENEPTTGNQPKGDPCKNPTTACKEWGPKIKVYNPYDCHQYYYCITNNDGNVVPSDEPLTCKGDLTFDFASQNCSSRISSCDKACVNKDCLFECVEGQDELVADPNDCNVYYFCINGILSPADSCSDSGLGPYFDGEGCTDKDYLCCDACTVYCTSDDVGRNISDPYNCYAYYTCKGEGIPAKDTHSYCDDGKYFENDSGACVVGCEYCQNICDNSTPST